MVRRKNGPVQQRTGPIFVSPRSDVRSRPTGGIIRKYRALVQGGRDSVERRAQVTANQRQRSNDGDRDQGSDEAILDGGRTLVGLKELANPSHDSLLFPGAALRAPLCPARRDRQEDRLRFQYENS